MKKWTAVIAAAAILCAVFAVGIFASPSDNVPSLFHNDEAWYKDEMAPALFRDGRFYVPSDFIAMFDYISFTTLRDGENLLLTNSDTGDYISILASQRAACANGVILEEVSIFRENGYYYLDTEFICDHLGLFVEYSREANEADRSVRIYDNTRMMTFDELLDAYAREQEAETEAKPEETAAESTAPEKNPQDRPTRIYLLCRDASGTEDVLAWSLAERLGFTCTMLLSEESDEIGKVDMNNAVILSVSDAAEAESLNGRLESMYCRRSHFVLSTGDEAEDKTLSRRGYYVMKPDFTVEKSTDASVVFGKLLDYSETHDTVTVLLGNVWQSETLLLLLSELDGAKYDIGAIPGFH